MDALGTMLGVWAHPDDETYLTAGLMAKAVREGSRVVCVTATRGEEGSFDEERWPTATMGKVREAELMRCLDILGVKDHRWLDYYDGTCASVPHEEGVTNVRAIVEEVRPDTVFTFGPDGMTDHADHKAVSAWTTDAFERVAKPGAKLFYATATPEWAEQYVPIFNKFNVFAPGFPPTTPKEKLAVYLELPSDLMKLKLAAIREHVSQVEGMLNAFGADFFETTGREEAFRLAAEKPRV